MLNVKKRHSITLFREMQIKPQCVTTIISPKKKKKKDKRAIWKGYGSQIIVVLMGVQIHVTTLKCCG